MSRAEEWTVAQVVDYLASVGQPVAADTWTSYVSRGQAPARRRRIGRTPVWPADAVREWARARPGRGHRSDLDPGPRCAAAPTDDPHPCDGPPQAVRVVSDDGRRTDTACRRHGVALAAAAYAGGTGIVYAPPQVVTAAQVAAWPDTYGRDWEPPAS